MSLPIPKPRRGVIIAVVGLLALAGLVAPWRSVAADDPPTQPEPPVRLKKKAKPTEATPEKRAEPKAKDQPAEPDKKPPKLPKLKDGDDEPEQPPEPEADPPPQGQPRSSRGLSGRELKRRAS